MRLAVDEFKKKFSIPVYATPGNHDVYNAEDAAAFGTVWGNVNNCFAYGDTLFILLESAKKYISEKQIEFLRTILSLERSKYTRCVIFSHVPPKTIPEFDTSKYRLSEKSAAELQKLLDQYNVDLLICGHVHYEMDILFGKTRLLVIPPSGQASRNKSNPRFGCLQIHFAENGAIKYEFVYVEKNTQKNKLNEFIYYRLNQRSILFCSALFMIILGVVLINCRKNDTDLQAGC
jgi:3',5'-cyclic AMP phosphodiesterase CpdA